MQPSLWYSATGEPEQTQTTHYQWKEPGKALEPQLPGGLLRLSRQSKWSAQFLKPGGHIIKLGSATYQLGNLEQITQTPGLSFFSWKTEI